ncbi:MAG: hypothetical protein JSR33_02305 [Proteobacteria bacterium]|nr:hypothetical protein [Pseudomonadota bacterium]
MNNSEAYKKINQRLWVILISTVCMHLIILGAYIKHHQNILNSNQGAIKAMERLVVRASMYTKEEDLKIILRELDHSGLKLGNNRLKFHIGNHPLKTSNNPEINYFYYPLPDGKWLSYSEQPITTLVKFPILIVLFEMGMMGQFIFYFWSTAQFINPLKKIKISADRFGEELHVEPLQKNGPIMVRETTDALHKMQIRIQDLINSRTQTLAAISHDLRTPITRLKLRAQFLDDNLQAEKIIADLDEMDTMINEIISFAQNDTTQEQKVKFDIYALLLSVCHYFIDRGHQVEMDGHMKSIPFFGKSIAVKRVFINLIENAIKYGGLAKVHLRVMHTSLKIIIEDNGPGIPPEELKKVLSPYYRANQTNNKNYFGNGLGLTITDQIIRAHRGTLTLKNLPKQGLQVTVILPLISSYPVLVGE